jgi:ribokinase
VAAVQLARWGLETSLFTVFGGDALGERAAAGLRARGVTVHAVHRDEPQRRALTLVDARRERTIVVVGDRHAPQAADPLPWRALADVDAVYLTAADAAAVRAARAARVLVATSRVLPLLREAAVELDALVGSDADPAEAYQDGDLTPAPRLVVRTRGARGGWYQERGGARHDFAAVPTEVRGDTYGAGDTFAAALTWGLAEGRSPEEATAFAAALAVEVLDFVGPYGPAESD